MKDTVPQHAGYITEADCNIDAFAALCSRTLDPSEVPFASEVAKNIAVYDGPALRKITGTPTAKREVMAEMARQLMSGSGVMVIRNAYEDTGVIDAATEVFGQIIAEERERGTAADHFAAAGANDRVWNALQKLCLAAPEVFAAYHGNPLIDLASEAWLGPNYQMTAQVNLVRPGGKAQQPHRDYHLGFMTAEESAAYPAHVHDLSPVLTLQGGIAHCDMGVEAGPTKLLPFSQAYREGYAAYRLPAFRDYFEAHHVQLPLSKGDLIFFNPALFHAGGENKTRDVQRLVNLLQVGSAMGRSIETVDRDAMVRALYPVLATSTLAPEARDAAISAAAEGYAFPTNLDRDPPVGGLAPETQAALMRRALREGMSETEFGAALDAMATRKRT
jgi:ectoine hydroxylase-related dioxygenase (phytanoyl-CoA dioxygenase family)